MPLDTGIIQRTRLWKMNDTICKTVELLDSLNEDKCIDYHLVQYTSDLERTTELRMSVMEINYDDYQDWDIAENGFDDIESPVEAWGLIKDLEKNGDLLYTYCQDWI